MKLSLNGHGFNNGTAQYLHRVSKDGAKYGRSPLIL